jgi:hypothetical protein
MPLLYSPREINEDRKRKFDRYEMMWIAPDEPHPRIPTRTGVVTKAASVSFYGSEFVLLASQQRNRTTSWLEKKCCHI